MKSKKIVYLIETPQKTIKFYKYSEAIKLYDKFYDLNVNVRLYVQFESVNIAVGD